MKIECAYTLANRKVRLQFLAMERSLRATGFDLPLKVFPYDDDTFDLPKGSEWFKPSLHTWLEEKQAHRMCCKYYCLTQSSYFFTDTDIIFLKDPRETLSPLEDFVVADTEWNKPRYTFTTNSWEVLAKQTSLWLKNVFNAGYFACDRVIYEESKLRELLQDPEIAKVCLYDNDQTGLNMLLSMAGHVPVNLNLPPFTMESTWAGDYPKAYQQYWKDPARKPFFIHWAGPVLDEEHPINDLFYEFLTAEEKAEWKATQANRLEKRHIAGQWPLGVRALNALVRLLYPKFYVQPRP